MNYKKLENYVKSNKLDMVAFFKTIGMSKAGYYAMLENETLKVEVLEKIAGTLNVPISTFFTDEEEYANIVQEPNIHNLAAENYLLLKENSKLKDEIIALQKQLAILIENASTVPGKPLRKSAKSK